MSNILRKVNSLVSWETINIELWLLIGILVTTFIPIRYLFPTSDSYILGYFSDFTSISLYISQLFIIGYIFYTLVTYFRKTGEFLLLKPLLLSVLLLGMYQIIVDPSFRLISGIFYVKLAISGGFIYCLINSDIWLKYRLFLIKCFISLGFISVIIGFIQFSLQYSIGLNILGESPISILTYGVAKIVAHGTTFVRIYGFMPHPNILAGLLVILSLLNLYLLNKELSISSRGIYIFTYCVNSLGIFLCFSRGGVIAYTVSTAIFLILTVMEQGIQAIFRKLYFVPILLIVLVFIFYPWYQSKSTISDQSSLLRSEYNLAGLKIIKSNWLIGTGPGTNLLHMKQELQSNLNYWDIQPIHNYFLIVISEFGVIGISWIMFLIYLSLRLAKQTYTNLKQNKSNTWHIALLSITIAIFILMQIDHYFYTNWSAQVILYLVIAWIYRETQSKIGESQNNVSRET